MVEIAKDSIGHLCCENENIHPHLDLQRIDFNHGCAKLVFVDGASRTDYRINERLIDNITFDAMAVYLSDDPRWVSVPQNVYSTIKSIIDHGEQLNFAEVSQFLQSRGFCILSDSEYKASFSANEYPEPFYGIEEIYGDPSTSLLGDAL
jgi:hypothetical protein